MAKNKQSLKVYLHETFVGYLSQESHNLTFLYDDSYLQSDEPPISIRLPLSDHHFDDETTRSFFTNLLPEGGFRQSVCQQLGISDRNDFALLKAIGRECAGAVSILPDNENLPGSGEWEYSKLTNKEINNLVHNHTGKTLMIGEEGRRLSLAGAQNKLPVYFDGTDIYLPENGAPSNHILKPAIGTDYPGSVANELFCNRLADAIGLSVPQTYFFHNHYLIERYDRVSRDGLVRRLHQEDFCQALGYSPSQKYQAEGGPGLKQCFHLLDQSEIPVLDKKALLEWVLFNVIIGNADAHAKNLSILYQGASFSLAPLYDLLCTAVYPGLSSKLAMKIGGENRLDWLMVRHWEKFAQEEADISIRMITNKLKKMAYQVVEVLPGVANTIFAETGDEIVSKISEFITRHCDKLQKL